jgi:hypothetical protein
MFYHPPYNPDLILSNYHIFTYLKNMFILQHFNNDEKFMEGLKYIVFYIVQHGGHKDNINILTHGHWQ